MPGWGPPITIYSCNQSADDDHALELLVCMYILFVVMHMHAKSDTLCSPTVICAVTSLAFAAPGTLHSYVPVGDIALFLRFSRTWWVKPLLVKSADGAALCRGTMVPSGKCHSPTLPPSIPLQHWVLTLLVTHIRDELESPIAVMSTVSPGR